MRDQPVHRLAHLGCALGGACALLALAALSCATVNKTRYAYQIEPAHSGARNARVFLLPPLNLNSVLPEELVAPAARVRDEVRDFLVETHGRVVVAPSFSEFNQAWTHCARQAEAAMLADPDAGGVAMSRAIALLAQQYAPEQRFDALVIGDLVIQSAWTDGHRAYWDGVSRRLRWVDNGRARMMGGSGSTVGVSLEISVYDRAGARVFHSRGGLDLIHEGNVLDSKMELVERPLHNLNHVRQGIAIAFDPYLPL